jgi:hypothetical protein
MKVEKVVNKYRAKDSLMVGLRCSLLMLALFSLLGCAEYVSADTTQLKQLGWLEQVRVYPAGLIFHAKLDTGADSCSVHAEKVRLFEKKKGKKKSASQWVKFEMTNRYGKRKKFERRVIRTAKVKKKDGGFQVRPVVRLGLCLGDLYESVECSLVDRSHFAYPVLIGRNLLAGGVAVNSSETYTTDPKCDDVSFDNE